MESYNASTIFPDTSTALFPPLNWGLNATTTTTTTTPTSAPNTWEASSGNGNHTASESAPPDDLTRKILLGIFFAVTIVTAIGGNLLVCVAVFTERRLKRVKNNYFIVSLAVADLLVACVVMTFAMPNDIQQRWMFGQVFCKIWICFDIMCSTASILNLCVISFDRYKHIHNAMYYDLWMTTKKALFFIASVWILSILISFLPIHLGLGLHQSGDSPPDTNASSTTPVHILDDADDVCMIEFNFVYAIVSSTVSFYAPCLVMLVLYFKLFLFARRHAITIRSMKRHPHPNTTPSSTGSGSQKVVTNGNSRSSLRASDHKAAFTLGVITGVFLCCWLPFFIINPISAYNSELIHPNAFTLCTWLGYVNSCLNPIIYSIFNTEFREAFKKILSLRTCQRDSNKFMHSSSRQNSARKKILKTVTNEKTPALSETVPITCVRSGSWDNYDEKITPL